MRRSKELIEDELGVPMPPLRLPVGRRLAGRRAWRRGGCFDSAALDAWRTNRRGRIDPYRLGRTPVLRGATAGRSSARRSTGYLDAEALLYRALGRGPWGRG